MFLYMQLHQILLDFHNSFTCTVSGKFVVKSSLKSQYLTKFGIRRKVDCFMALCISALSRSPHVV